MIVIEIDLNSNIKIISSKFSELLKFKIKKKTSTELMLSFNRKKKNWLKYSDIIIISATTTTVSKRKAKKKKNSKILKRISHKQRLKYLLYYLKK